MKNVLAISEHDQYFVGVVKLLEEFKLVGRITGFSHPA